MTQGKIKLKSFQKEQIPVGAKLFYDKFNSQLIRQASLEYWEIHDFNWTTRKFPNLKFEPSTAKNFLSEDYPADMSDALSVNAFAELYREIEALPESECCTKIREFCILVCSIGKTMELLKSWFGNKIATTNEELFEVAVKIGLGN